MSPTRPRPRRAALLVAAVALLAGCGSDTAPADAVPELTARLEKVDAAVASGDLDRAREAVNALVRTTAQAEVAGTLDDRQADRIMAAAASLLEQLPAEDPEPSQPDETSTPSESAVTETPTEEPEEDYSDDGGDEDEDDD